MLLQFAVVIAATQKIIVCIQGVHRKISKVNVILWSFLYIFDGEYKRFLPYSNQILQKSTGIEVQRFWRKKGLKEVWKHNFSDFSFIIIKGDYLKLYKFCQQRLIKVSFGAHWNFPIGSHFPIELDIFIIILPSDWSPFCT